MFQKYTYTCIFMLFVLLINEKISFINVCTVTYWLLSILTATVSRVRRVRVTLIWWRAVLMRRPRASSRTRRRSCLWRYRTTRWKMCGRHTLPMLCPSHPPFSLSRPHKSSPGFTEYVFCHPLTLGNGFFFLLCTIWNYCGFIIFRWAPIFLLFFFVEHIYEIKCSIKKKIWQQCTKIDAY